MAALCFDMGHATQSLTYNAMKSKFKSQFNHHDLHCNSSKSKKNNNLIKQRLSMVLSIFPEIDESSKKQHGTTNK
eukprot:89428-Amphidinium_carterae.1